MPSEDSNPRLQCEKCGKWRRLLMNLGGEYPEQCMFPYSEDTEMKPEDFKGDRPYDCICVWCIKKFEGQSDAK